MTKSSSLLFLTAALFPVLLQAFDIQAPMPSQVEIFTNGRYPVSNDHSVQAPIQIYDLDAPARLDDELSTGLPSDPDQAQALALKRLNTLGPEKIADMVNQAYEGVTKAMSYKLTKIPAIVFDGGTSVIYGIADIRDAVRRYQAWQQREAR
jgi:integrating conjugative element protein (TIGR03757 family)